MEEETITEEKKDAIFVPTDTMTDHTIDAIIEEMIKGIFAHDVMIASHVLDLMNEGGKFSLLLRKLEERR